MTTETFSSGSLTLEVSDDGDAIRVQWYGKSTARDPGQFVLPILTKVLDESSARRKPIVIDFQKTEYLNSSTITPLIRVLETARRGSHQVTVLYNKNLKWQALNFAALEVFHTDDHRIEIRGL